ncbi:MAG: hypothetical protein PVJ53_10275 [Desulfobacterales bacterium]|jgi:hypothetical protein
MKQITIVLVLVAFMGGCLGPVKPDQDILHDICWAHDLFGIYERDRLFFTFNVQLPDKRIVRQWEWRIKTNRIFLNGKEQKSSQAFVNDIYWLLFPLKAYEARDQIEVTVKEHQPAPLSKKNHTEVVIRFVGDKGYTPNDTYKLYVDENLIVREWSYLKASREPPARITTWQDYQTFGKSKLSLLREGPGGFKVWFTDVRVE